MATAGSRNRYGSRGARYLSRCLVAVLVAALAPVGAPAATAAPTSPSGSMADAAPSVSVASRDARVAVEAQGRLAAHGFHAPASALGVWHDGRGTLVALRNTRLAGSAGGELIPVAAPPAVATNRGRTVAAIDDQPMGWSLVFSQCYERISDTWAWLDHCARIFRLTGDRDPARDYYGLQRLATAGSNAPWVLKAAAIAATPIDPALMTWVDWSPRSDRSGPCQSFAVWITAPFAGLMTPLDRCETWDITKGARGGDFRLDWSGCACTHDRALAFDVVVSVPQGRNPAWYVPAEVHGFAF